MSFIKKYCREFIYLFCNENIKNRKCFISLEERENHKKTILQQINSN